MPETIRCPDCGHDNPSGSENCTRCNFPLAAEAAASPPVAETAPRPEPAIPAPRRPRRPRPASNQALSLWLMFGFIAAAILVFVAFKANRDRSSQPVEGSTEDQQKQADQFRALLDKDSTDVQAHVGLANLLYDTANWSEAIAHYNAALRRDSSLTPALVDLGVCHFNLGNTAEAERLFRLALQRDPHQPVALFNLGFVSERRSDYAAALTYYHRALQSAPPEGMRQPLIEAMQRVQKATGKVAPPLPDGR